MNCLTVSEQTSELRPLLNITFITPAPAVKRMPIYHFGGRLYGHSNAITGPLILAGIAKRAGHHVEAYEELNGQLPMRRLLAQTDVLCLSAMTSNAPRAYELAELFHKKGHARVLMGGCIPLIARRRLPNTPTKSFAERQSRGSSTSWRDETRAAL